jgi:hypothetical protein
MALLTPDCSRIPRDRLIAYPGELMKFGSLEWFAWGKKACG